MISILSHLFRRSLHPDSLQMIQIKGCKQIHTFFYEKNVKLENKSLNVLKNTFLENINLDRSFLTRSFPFRIRNREVLRYSSSLNYGIASEFFSKKYLKIKKDMFQFQKKQFIFTYEIVNNSISCEKTIKGISNSLKDTLSPAVISLLKHYNIIDFSEIKKTGPRGRLLKGDILAYVGVIKEDSPLRLLKVLERKEKSVFRSIKIKPTQSVEYSFATINIPVSLEPLFSMEKSFNEKLFKIDFSNLVNKAIYKAFQNVPSIILKKPSYQEILFSTVLGEIPKYYDNINTNYRNFESDYFEDKKTSVIWKLPENIRMRNTVFPSSIFLTIEKINETSTQNLDVFQKDLDIIDFLSKEKSYESSLSIKKNIFQYTTFIKMKFDKSYTDICVANAYVNELKKYLEIPEKLLL
ncbi:hypothetical protein PMAC_000533 [Pneumocystis sp. 'macacae']|nr:hypothetical protein PMAC_000533 [Pneumocystis sp. 'macacae']